LRNNGCVIRLVATDLDGTFWDASFVPPSSHVAVVGDLVDAGVTVLAATSRRPRLTRQRLCDAGLLLPAVLIDGSLGVDFRTEERFHQACFGSEVALGTLLTFRTHGLDPCIYVEHPDFDIVVSETPSTCAAHLARLGPLASTGDLELTAATSDVYAFSVLGLSRERLGPVLDELVQTNDSSAILYREPDYGKFGLIVNPPGVSKWTGIEAYCRLHEIEPSEVMAVGDGLNDVPMLKQAGVAVAVRDGASEAIAVSQHLIDPPSASGWTQILDLLGQY
jgi:hydroxymethylpyrimidine pyrophosphatase-like HAD family hydrolase